MYRRPEPKDPQFYPIMRERANQYVNGMLREAVEKAENTGQLTTSMVLAEEAGLEFLAMIGLNVVKDMRGTKEDFLEFVNTELNARLSEYLSKELTSFEPGLKEVPLDNDVN
jgi:hypothetical protein